jgi:FAD/FMN-containing dehydrogenase
MEIVERIRAIVGERGVLDCREAALRKAGIWRDDSIKARAIIRPRTTDELSAVLACCHAAGQAVVIHGGLTGLVRGADSTASDIVLSLERMRDIEAMDPIGRTVTVQAGVPLQQVQEAAEAHGLMFPLDLGARGSAQIGGNIATNAGGNRVIRFGMVRDMVLGLEVVLADGTVISALNQMLKNNAGYDLKQLFIGTEGTLGVITRAVLRLREAPRSRSTALVGINEFDAAVQFLRLADSGLGGMLSAFEVMWRDFYSLVTAATRGKPPVDDSFGLYVLLEALGGDPAGDESRFENILSAAIERGLIGDAVVAKSEAQRTALWALRDDVEQVFQYSPMQIFDVSLPLTTIPGYLDLLRQSLEAQWPQNRLFVFGHLGDGNLHLAISTADPDPAAQRQLEEIVYRPLGELGGSVSAEHGIGMDKKPYLRLCRSETEISLMKGLKAALDPAAILNPGKVVDPA